MDLDALLARYEALGEERDFLAARPLFELAVAEREDARVLNNYGYLLECHGRNGLRQAAALYERAIELDPEFDKPHYQLISARAGLREPERAVSMYEKRLASNPRGVREHRFLAQAYVAANAYARALEAAKAGLALAPADPALVATRGEAKAGLGEVGRAGRLAAGARTGPGGHRRSLQHSSSLRWNSSGRSVASMRTAARRVGQWG